MQYENLSEADYLSLRYQALLALEESGVPSERPYVDPLGLPTMGVGFNLTDRFVREQVLIVLLTRHYNRT